MSCLKFDFHTVCSDCDLKTRCIKCIDVDDSTVQDYVSHKLSLKRRLLAKRKHKAPIQTCMVMTEPEVFDGDVPPATPVSPVVTTVVSSDPVPQLVNQVKLMFYSFKESLEARFASIGHRFSQISASSASPVSLSNISCQDAIKHSFCSPLSSGCALRASA